MKNIRLLLIDENAFALHELCNLFKYMGCTNFESTHNSKVALELIRTQDFDCVISGWDLAEMSGLALLKNTRQDDRLFELPFFLTHHAFTKVLVVQAGQAGVTGLIVKPFDVKNIQGKIQQLSEGSYRRKPSKAQQTLEKGMALLEEENYEQALEIFETVTQKGETAEYYYNIGYIKTTEEKYGEAIEAFRKATEIDRLFAKAFKAMGHAYQKIGREDEAQKYLQKAAEIYMGNENVDDAEEILNELLSLNQDTVNVYNSLGVLYRKKGDLETSLKHYLKAIKVHPQEPAIYYNIGRLYIDMRDPKEAKRYFVKALEIDPDFKEAREIVQAIEFGTF